MSPRSSRPRRSALVLPLVVLAPLLVTSVPAAAAEPATYLGVVVDTAGGPRFRVIDIGTSTAVFTSPGHAFDGAVATAPGAPTVAYVGVQPGGTSEQLRLTWPGGSDTALYTAAPDEMVSEPVVSSDGESVAFVVDDDTSSALLVADLPTGSVRVLRRSTTTVYAGPSFSPDADWISWAQDTSAESALVVTRVATGAATVVARSGFISYEDTAWAPDGTQLAAVRRTADSGGGYSASLELNDLRTGAVRVFLRGSTTSDATTDFVEPAWGPDGTAVYATRARESDRGEQVDLVRISTEVGSFADVVPVSDYLGAPSLAGPWPPADSTAPAPVQGLTATVTGSRAQISYTLPADRDLADVIVTRSTGAPAATPTATIEVGRSRAVTFDVPLPSPGTDYGISVFSRDWSGNVSPAATLGVRSPDAGVLSISTPPARVVHRTPVRLTGRLMAAGRPVAGQRVVLHARRAMTSTAAAVASATTAADGSYALVWTPPWTAELQVRSAGGAAATAAASAKRVVSVTPVVSLSLSATRTAVGRAVVLSGAVAPAHGGQLVDVQRYVSGAWRTLASVRLSAAGSYRYVLTPRSRGTWTLRVSKRADGDHLAAVSPARSLTVG